MVMPLRAVPADARGPAGNRRWRTIRLVATRTAFMTAEEHDNDHHDHDGGDDDQGYLDPAW
jgi:hypothetical protein